MVGAPVKIISCESSSMEISGYALLSAGSGVFVSCEMPASCWRAVPPKRTL